MANNNRANASIYVMGGGLVKGKNGVWRTTNYNEGDKFGAIGDRASVVAASLLFKANPRLKVFVTGGKGQLSAVPGVPVIAKVIKGELIKLGVPGKNIFLETGANNTCQQLLALQKFFKTHQIIFTRLISNKHGLPRIKAMIEYKPELANLKKQVNNKKLIFTSAESVLIAKQSKIWAGKITKAYASRGIKQRIKMEQQGVRQIKNGTYRFK